MCRSLPVDATTVRDDWGSCPCLHLPSTRSVLFSKALALLPLIMKSSCLVGLCRLLMEFCGWYPHNHLYPHVHFPFPKTRNLLKAGHVWFIYSHWDSERNQKLGSRNRYLGLQKSSGRWWGKDGIMGERAQGRLYENWVREEEAWWTWEYLQVISCANLGLGDWRGKDLGAKDKWRSRSWGEHAGQCWEGLTPLIKVSRRLRGRQKQGVWEGTQEEQMLQDWHSTIFFVHTGPAMASVSPPF